MTATEMGYRPPIDSVEYRDMGFTKHTLMYDEDVPVEAIERYWFGQYPPEGYGTIVTANEPRDGVRLVVVRRYSSTGD